MFRTDRFALANAVLMIDEPGADAPTPAPAAAPAVEAPPKEPTFDDVTKAMFDTMQREMGEPAAAATPAAPLPPATATPAAPLPPAQPAPESLATLQLLQKMQATQDQMLTAMQPRKEEVTPKPSAPPTVKEIMRDYQPPARSQGEDDGNYAARNQAAVLDHMNAGNARWLQEQSRNIAKETVEAYQQQVQQQAYMQHAERTLRSELDQAVQTAGFPAESMQARFLRGTLEAEVRQGIAGGRFQGHTDQTFRAGLRQWVTEAKKLMAPPPPAPGVRPNLQVVDAPISAGGATAPPKHPQSTSAAAPKSFEEAMGNSFGQWTRNG